MRYLLIPIICLLFQNNSNAQFSKLKNLENGGLFSLGMRSTISAFGHEDKAGLGVGGQFRLQFHPKVNTEWFLDYIKTSMTQGAERTDVHIGWSVMYYPLRETGHTKLLKPYLAIGHCFDRSAINVLDYPELSASRWSAAVQGGAGCHLNLTEKFDITFLTQYMLHLGNELTVDFDEHNDEITDHRHATPEGHLLFTLGVNYKLAELW